jgi:hypothetical protein
MKNNRQRNVTFDLLRPIPSRYPHLTIILHRKPRVQRIRKRHSSRLRPTRNPNLIPHRPLTRRRINHHFRRPIRTTLQRHRAEKRHRSLVQREDIDRARARRCNRVPRGEVNFELAPVGARGDVGEGQGVDARVGAVGVLVDVVVDGEADGARVRGLASAGDESGCGGGEQGGAQECGGEGGVLHFGEFEFEGLEMRELSWWMVELLGREDVIGSGLDGCCDELNLEGLWICFIFCCSAPSLPDYLRPLQLSSRVAISHRSS